MICKNCGAELLDDVKFCTNCGMPTAPAQQENYSSYNDQAYPPQDYAPVQYYPPQQEYSNQQPYPPQYYPPQGYYPAPQPKRKNIGLRVFLVVFAAVIGVSVISGAAYYIVTGHLPFTERSSVVEPSSAPVGTVVDKGTEAPENSDIYSVTDAPTQPRVLDSATGFSGARASSTLGDMGGYNYSASNVLKDDGSCWCEGAKGYGIGESITLELPEMQRVSGLYIRNGYAGTEKQYKDNATIEDIEIVFSEGERTTATLKTLSTSQRKSIQKITFSQPVDTSSVTIIIKSTSKADCEDTCLTYVAPF